MEPREAQSSLRGPARNLLHCMEEVFLLKPFKTLDEQIQILKDRKLIISNEDYAKTPIISLMGDSFTYTTELVFHFIRS